MVSLSGVRSSNAKISTSLPSELVAVFAGATSGIGEYTLKQFAKCVGQPRIYFLGRSQEAGQRITAECQKINPKGEYQFIKADLTLLHVVDEVCQDIKRKEKSINLLVLSTGTMTINQETTEGLNSFMALAHYSRTRFIVNLLPLLQQATALRRVISVFTAGKEGKLYADDIQGKNVPMLSARGHAASLVSVTLEAVAAKAPDVTFIHNFPGSVKSGLARRGQGAVVFAINTVCNVLAPFVFMSPTECGERHVFLATSARYPAKGGDASPGVPLADALTVAKGVNGEVGSGVYSIEADGESAGPEVQRLLATYREDGTTEKVWKHTQGEFVRITGREAI